MSIKTNMRIGIWNVSYRKHNETTWRPLPCVKDFWYADPMLFNRKDRKFLFLEAFDEKKQIGKIAVSEYKNNYFEVPKVVLQRPYHLSYPSVFEWKNKIYMLPESSQNRTMELYVAEDNDLVNWRKKCVLLDHVRYVDTTVVSDKDGMILYAYEEFEKKYVTHIMKLDIDKEKVYEIGRTESLKNNERPAGYIFEYQAKKYRPLQVSSRCYGESITIREYSEPLLEREKDVYSITPCSLHKDGIVKNALRTHTLAYDRDIEVIDYLTEYDSWKNIFRNFLRRGRNGFFKIRARIQRCKN